MYLHHTEVFRKESMRAFRSSLANSPIYISYRHLWKAITISLVEETLAAIPPEDEVIVCSDVFGGSVNNEFMKQLRNRNHMHLITGMNLPLLMQLFLSVEEDTEKMIHDIVNSEDTRVKYCNDMLRSAAKEEEDF